jgi:hypothetical protein
MAYDKIDYLNFQASYDYNSDSDDEYIPEILEISDIEIDLFDDIREVFYKYKKYDTRVSRILINDLMKPDDGLPFYYYKEDDSIDEFATKITDCIIGHKNFIYDEIHRLYGSYSEFAESNEYKKFTKLRKILDVLSVKNNVYKNIYKYIKETCGEHLIFKEDKTYKDSYDLMNITE